jgi:LacI family transcriptional regulator
VVTGNPKQADIARLAGVSQPMVSYVLNGRANFSIPADTRQRILEAATQLGYEPDQLARSLRTRKTRTLACVIPDIANPFYPMFERGVQDVAESQGYDLMVYNTDGDEAKERRCLKALIQRRVDGVVGVFFHLRARDLEPLLTRGVPVVRLEATPKRLGSLPLDSIFVDNAAAAQAAVSYLLERGHRQIGMIAGSGGPQESRRSGYQQALAAHGVPIDGRLIVPCALSVEGGHIATREVLRLIPQLTALFAVNDIVALGVMEALRSMGLRVPDDVAVVGFDDISMARLVSPALSTVSQFQEHLGRRATEMLFERLGSDAPIPGRLVQMPYELVIREST